MQSLFKKAFLNSSDNDVRFGAPTFCRQCRPARRRSEFSFIGCKQMLMMTLLRWF